MCSHPSLGEACTFQVFDECAAALKAKAEEQTAWDRFREITKKTPPEQIGQERRRQVKLKLKRSGQVIAAAAGRLLPQLLLSQLLL